VQAVCQSVVGAAQAVGQVVQALGQIVHHTEGPSGGSAGPAAEGLASRTFAVAP
jgi:hypothetical protein